MNKFLTSLLLSLTINSYANNIELYTLTSMPFESNQKDTCYLDYVDNATKDINQMLSLAQSDSDIEKVLTKERLDEISRAMICKFNAASKDIKKIPAIVIDDKYVVYGVTNIQIALRIVSEYEKA